MRKSLNFITAQTVDTVLEAALNRKPESHPTILGTIPEDQQTKIRKSGLRQ